MPFFLKLFLFIVVFASGIAVLEAVEEVIIGEVGAEFFLTSSYSPSQIFLKAAYSFFFLICQRNICLIGSLDNSLLGWD